MGHDSTDRPATEIEITDAMIEAGVDEFFRSCSDSVELSGSLTARDLVGRIVGATLAARNAPTQARIDLECERRDR